jgi:YfiH family protein
MSFSLKYASNGIWFGVFGHLNHPIITHGISTRLGGKSQNPYSSLNLGLHTGDELAAVRENRGLFCQAVGINHERIVTAEQTHGERVVAVIDQAAGKGAMDFSTSVKATDALITNSPNLPLMLFFADCVPILLFDPKMKVIGVVHAGWKGTVAKIAQKAVLAMQSEYGTDPKDCIVGIAPSIGPCCYEVNEPVAQRFKEQFSNHSGIVIPHAEKWRLDLWLANQVQLEEIGVRCENIQISHVCTSCNQALFFSYRAEAGTTGRIGAVMQLNCL